MASGAGGASAAGPAGSGLNLALLAAGSAVFSISTMFSAMKPVLISRFVEQTAFSPSLAGLAAAMPFVGGAVTSFCMPALLRRIGARRALTGFSLGLVVAEAANAMWFAIPALVLFGQFVAGVCGGVLMGMVSRLVAISDETEKTFGIIDMAGVLMMSAMIAAVGSAVAWDGLRGGFLAAAALCALFALIIIRCRKAIPQASAAAASPGAATTARAGELPGVRIGWRAVAVIALGVLFVTFSGLGFAFMFSAALNLGFGYDNAGSAIGIILFVSASGCLIGGWSAAKFGPRRPLFAAFVVCGLGWHIALHTQNWLIFLMALAPAIFALQFCFPILLSLPASIDENGEVAAIAAPLITSGFAWAAITAGIVVELWGIGALSIATILGMIVCAALLTVVTRPSP